ncbi:MAG: ATP-binding protein [Verrucomicrobiota bacterium]
MESQAGSYLLFLEGPRKGELLFLTSNEITLGRKGCDITLADEEVSRVHARVFCEGSDYIVEDAGRRNGTLVNGNPAPRATLADGDRIGIGKTVARFSRGTAGPSGVPWDVSGRIGDTVTLEAQEGDLATRRIDESDPAAVQRARADLASLYRSGQAINAVIHTAELYSRVPEMVIHEMSSVEHCSMHCLDEVTGELRCVGHWSRAENSRSENPVFSRSIAQVVLRDGRGVLSRDAGVDKRFGDQISIAAQGIRSALCAPLKSRDRLLGVLHASSTAAADCLKPDDLRLLMAIGMQAGAALENALLYEKLAGEKAELDKAHRALQAAQEVLVRSEKLAAMGRMTAGIVHDVKNPMTVILGYADLLGQSLKKAGVEKAGTLDVGECVGEIQTGVLHCKEVIDKLLKFARQSKPEKTRLQINAIIEETVSFLRHEIMKAGGRCETQLAPDLPEVLADASEMKQVLINILLNDIEAFRKEEPGFIEISTSLQRSDGKQFVIVAIRDNGLGMTEDVQRKLFEPFFTTKKEGGRLGGTGLGLAMTYGIVQNHGGTISAESTPGKGTTFVVSLPVAAP